MPKTRRDGGYTLRDSPFFRLRSRKRLAKLLRVSVDTLGSISRRKDLYSRRWKHKKLKDDEKGAWLTHPPRLEQAEYYRPIDIPEPRLKAMQARIADLLGRVEAPEFLFSPVKGRSYVANAAYHKASNAFWQLDVADYFPSCSANNVARFFRRELECSEDVTAVLVHLVTLGDCLPQGSPCSPILAYFSNSHIWLEADKLIRSQGCRWSLYADDITISGDMVPKALIWEVKQLIYSNGLRLKDSKEVSLINAPADITGVIVKNCGTHLPNRHRKSLAELKRDYAQTTNPERRLSLANKIRGRVAQQKQVENPKSS